jgi:hypothetical protein
MTSVAILPTEITDLIRKPAETTVGVRHRTGEVVETVEKRRFSPSIGPDYKCAKPSIEVNIPEWKRTYRICAL